jgi:protein TonB
MSYVDQNNRREKSLSGIGSAVLVAGVGYALVTGLAVNIVKVVPPNLVMHDYTDPVSPPPKPIPPRPVTRTATTATTPTQIQPIVKAPDPGFTVIPLSEDATQQFVLPKIGDGAATADTGTTASQAIAARPRGAPSEWVTTDDYPANALRAGEQGRTGFRLDIGADGRVTGCTITQSSGSADLDQTACRILTRRARFTPARDAAGNPIASNYASNVLWKLPSE